MSYRVKVTPFTSSTGPAIKETFENYSAQYYGGDWGKENNYCPVGTFNSNMTDCYYQFTIFYDSSYTISKCTLDDCYWRFDRNNNPDASTPRRVGPSSMDMDTYNKILASSVDGKYESRPYYRLYSCSSPKKTPLQVTSGFTPLSPVNSLNLTSTPLYLTMGGPSLFQYPSSSTFKFTNTMTTLAETNYGPLNGGNMYEGSFAVNGNNYTQFNNILWNDDHTFAIDLRTIPLPFYTAWHYTSMWVGAFYVVTKNGTCYRFENIQPTTNQNVAVRIMFDTNGVMSIALKDINQLTSVP